MPVKSNLSDLIYAVEQGEEIKITVRPGHEWTPKVAATLDKGTLEQTPKTKGAPEFVFTVNAAAGSSHFVGLQLDFGGSDEDDSCRFDVEGDGPGDGATGVGPYLSIFPKSAWDLTFRFDVAASAGEETENAENQDE